MGPRQAAALQTPAPRMLLRTLRPPIDEPPPSPGKPVDPDPDVPVNPIEEPVMPPRKSGAIQDPPFDLAETPLAPTLASRWRRRPV